MLPQLQYSTQWAKRFFNPFLFKSDVSTYRHQNNANPIKNETTFGNTMASRKILILDDDLDILAVMQLLFKTKGFDVVALSRWEEVYDKVETFKPHLILLDVLLSGNDGRDICRELKQQPSTKNIPIVMFSANPSAADNIHEYGADDFIHKPFEVIDLLNTINKHLQKTAYSA